MGMLESQTDSPGCIAYNPVELFFVKCSFPTNMEESFQQLTLYFKYASRNEINS